MGLSINLPDVPRRPVARNGSKDRTLHRKGVVLCHVAAARRNPLDFVRSEKWDGKWTKNCFRFASLFVNLKKTPEGEVFEKAKYERAVKGKGNEKDC